ncbi:MAG TPA: hypothetical protein P5117_01455 [Spirochaetia bacterium]|nr:hypothetical protein [Spirochaetales bacterium]HRY81873.1 hypothetical protein [Spirochaetia bacterium]HRZ88123.1 hypothetical protein [Spirochaetia bacterium]
MEGNGEYERILEEKLLAKAETLDRVELPKLKEAFKLFQTAFQGIHTVLLRKGVIQKDPYKFDLKISEVQTPPESPFAESEKNEQISVRLSQFDSYLDFLNGYYQFSVDFLTMGRVKRLINFTKYFNFLQFSETSNQLNTRCFAEVVGLVRKGTDPLSTGILGEGLLSLEKTSREIFQILKSLTLYHKERYKLDIRQLALAGLTLDRERVITHRDEALRSIKRKFSETMGDRPFYPELVEEVLAEDYSSDGPNLRDDILAQLQVKEEKKADSAQARNFKAIVLDGARVLAGAGYQLEEAIRKLRENSILLENQNRTFLGQMRKMIRRLFNPAEDNVVYQVEYSDPITAEHRREEIDFTRLSEEIARRARVLASMMARNSQSWQRLASAPEEQAYSFLVKGLEDLQRYYRRLSALDEHFKNEITDPEAKPRIRGIKVELATLKTSIIKANQKKHEYVAQKEEIEQMRRLGIRAETP